MSKTPEFQVNQRLNPMARPQSGLSEQLRRTIRLRDWSPFNQWSITISIVRMHWNSKGSGKDFVCFLRSYARKSFRIPRDKRPLRIPTRLVLTSGKSHTPNLGSGLRQSCQPRRPKAKICCFLSSLKTLATAAEATTPLAGVNVPEIVSVGRFSCDNQWPVLGDR